jgi:mRNA interferase MazF
MKRGDLVLVATSGDFGKSRPALVVQTDLFAEHPSVTVSLITSHLLDSPLCRYLVQPDAESGLTVPSHVQIDKIMTVMRSKINGVIGRLTEKQMSEVTKLLALWIGIADH